MLSTSYIFLLRFIGRCRGRFIGRGRSGLIFFGGSWISRFWWWGLVSVGSYNGDDGEKNDCDLIINKNASKN